MNTQSNPASTLLPPQAGSPVPRNIYASQEEWDSLNDEQRQFLIDAAEVSMAHLIENGEVVAWGPGLAQFTMAVDARHHPQDGWVVTLPENGDERRETHPNQNKTMEHHADSKSPHPAAQCLDGVALLGFDKGSTAGDRSALHIGLTREQHVALMRADLPPGDTEGLRLKQKIADIRTAALAKDPDTVIHVFIREHDDPSAPVARNRIMKPNIAHHRPEGDV